MSTERVLAIGGGNAATTRQVDYFYHQHFLNAVINGGVDVAIQHEPARRRYEDSQQFFGIAPSAWRPTLDFIEGAVKPRRSGQGEKTLGP